MDEMAHTSLKDRINSLYFQINDIHPNKRGDLMRLWKHTQQLWSELDKEMVQCRRLQKLTAHYKSLEEAINESLSTVEQYIMWANLLD
jgi:hypothetical protein